MVVDKLVNHFNVHALGDPRLAARWHNALQECAEATPHGIPVTVSTDPRHSFAENAGASFAAGAFSQWPEMLGLAALRDEEVVRGFAQVMRRGVCRCRHPRRPSPDPGPGDRAAVGAAGADLRR